MSSLVTKIVDQYDGYAGQISAVYSGPTNITDVLILQGPAASQYTGRFIHMESLRLRGTITFVRKPSPFGSIVFSPQTITNIVRVIVVVEKVVTDNFAGVSPSFDEIFGGLNPSGTFNVVGLYSGINPSTTSRFKVLRDFCLHEPSSDSALGNGGVTLASGSGTIPADGGIQTSHNVPFDEFIELGLDAEFPGTGTINNPLRQSRTNRIWVVFRALLDFGFANPQVSSAFVGQDTHTRLRFKDY